MLELVQLAALLASPSKVSPFLFYVFLFCRDALDIRNTTDRFKFFRLGKSNDSKMKSYELLYDNLLLTIYLLFLACQGSSCKQSMISWPYFGKGTSRSRQRDSVAGVVLLLKYNLYMFDHCGFLLYCRYFAPLAAPSMWFGCFGKIVQHLLFCTFTKSKILNFYFIFIAPPLK